MKNSSFSLSSFPHQTHFPQSPSASPSILLFYYPWPLYEWKSVVSDWHSGPASPAQCHWPQTYDALGKRSPRIEKGPLWWSPLSFRYSSLDQSKVQWFKILYSDWLKDENSSHAGEKKEAKISSLHSGYPTVKSLIWSPSYYWLSLLLGDNKNIYFMEKEAGEDRYGPAKL